jgi:hypothetical protein
MDPAAALLERGHRARDASGLLQLAEEPRSLGVGHGDHLSAERGIGDRVRAQPVEQH